MEVADSVDDPGERVRTAPRVTVDTDIPSLWRTRDPRRLVACVASTGWGRKIPMRRTPVDRRWPPGRQPGSGRPVRRSGARDRPAPTGGAQGIGRLASCRWSAAVLPTTSRRPVGGQ